MNKTLTVGLAVLALSLGTATVVAASTRTASLETSPATVSDVGPNGEQGQQNQGGDQGHQPGQERDGAKAGEGRRGGAEGQVRDQVGKPGRSPACWR